MKLVPLDRIELNKVGVDLIKDGARWLLRCQKCGQTWPAVDERTQLIPTDYWMCRRGCNLPAPPEPETELDPERPYEPGDYEMDWRAYYLKQHEFYSKMERDAKDDEERARWKGQADRYLEMYLAEVHDEEAEK